MVACVRGAAVQGAPPAVQELQVHLRVGGAGHGGGDAQGRRRPAALRGHTMCGVKGLKGEGCGVRGMGCLR